MRRCGMTKEEIIRRFVCVPSRIAVVGASPKPERPVNGVMEYLKRKGFSLSPVNPAYAGRDIHDVPCVGSLGELPQPVDVVALFVSSEQQKDIFAALVRLPYKPVVWMQPGAENVEAERTLRAQDYDVVSGECLMAVSKSRCASS
jgi:hypothetical protein